MNRGFTLIELIGTMLILSILAVTMWPRAPSRESLTLQARADQLASDIRYAQTLSMTAGQRYCLTLNPTAGPPYSGYSITTAASNCVTTVAHPAGLTQPIALCVSGTCVTAPALGNDYVQFDGLGIPYTAAATPLAVNAVITISDDGSKTITVSPQTGRVLVQ